MSVLSDNWVIYNDERVLTEDSGRNWTLWEDLDSVHALIYTEYGVRSSMSA